MKINGQRAYKLARKGEIIELAARPVTIYESRLMDYEYPLVKFTSRVGSGTYIRSLVDDLGTVLETGAYMADLRRTRIADYDVEDAALPEGLSADSLSARLRALE
jgi:tRNA pseudouridine55 synthase